MVDVNILPADLTGQKIDENRSNKFYFNYGKHRVYYSIYGRGPHKLLMLPGSLSTCDEEFEPQISGLDLDTFTLIMMDTPGFGRSWPPEKDYSIEFHLHDARAAIHLMTTVLNYDKYSVLGFSDGGRSAYQLVTQQPDSINKLIVASCSAFMTPTDRRRWMAFRDITQWTDKRRKLFEPIYGDKLQEVWGRYSDALVDTKVTKELLNRIRCPTLFMRGGNDIMVSQVQSNFYQNNIRGCKTKTFDGAGHSVHQERSKEFNEIVTKFLLSG